MGSSKIIQVKLLGSFQLILRSTTIIFVHIFELKYELLFYFIFTSPSLYFYFTFLCYLLLTQ